jgi:3-dehydroquinate synthase
MNITNCSTIKTRHSDTFSKIINGIDLVCNLDKIQEIRALNSDHFLLLADRQVFKLFGKSVISSLKRTGVKITVSTFPAGERSKNLNRISAFAKPFLVNRLTRNSVIITLGGGVASDIGGFMASILLRGIKFINIPTTFLAQIDASIGGKTGVNFTLNKDSVIKNMIGTFHNPALVICDTDTLSTLPKTEILNGLGELLKYHIGWDKPKILTIKTCFRPRQKSINDKLLAEIINACQEVKLSCVEKDPFETKNLRIKLNFGHTVGHAIEGLSKGKLSHGECVALGILAALKISVMKKLITEFRAREIKNLIKSFGFTTSISDLSADNIIENMKHDKKHGKFVLIKDIGNLVTADNVSNREISQSLKEIII